MDVSEVLSTDFLGLETSAASLTSSASTTSLASTTSIAQFYQKNLLVLMHHDGWVIPGTKNTNTGPFLWNGSSKIQFFTDI